MAEAIWVSTSHVGRTKRLEHDRQKVVRAFVEWYNAMPGTQIGEWTIDIFIRTHLGGE